MLSLRAHVVLSLALVLVAFALGASTSRAASAPLTGTVTAPDGSPVAGATVTAIDAATGATSASATTDAQGTYALTLPPGAYNVQATPPTGSPLSPQVGLNVTVPGVTTLDFALVPASPVNVGGQVRDPAGQPLAGQHLELYNATSFASTTTDSSGNFTFAVVPGGYTLALYGDSSLDAGLPRTYYVYTTAPLNVSQNTTLNLTFPALTRVTVRVQGPAGNPLANVAVASSEPIVSGLTLGGLPATGFSTGGGTTDDTGDVTLPLFPTTPGAAYSFTTTPPSGSSYVAVTASDVAVTGDSREIDLVETTPTPPTPSPTAAPTTVPTASPSPTIRWPAPTVTIVPTATSTPTSPPSGRPAPPSSPSPTETSPASGGPPPSPALSPAAPSATPTTARTAPPAAIATAIASPTVGASAPSPGTTFPLTIRLPAAVTFCVASSCRSVGRGAKPSANEARGRSVEHRLAAGPPPRPLARPPRSDQPRDADSGPRLVTVQVDADLSRTGVSLQGVQANHGGPAKAGGTGSERHGRGNRGKG